MTSLDSPERLARTVDSTPVAMVASLSVAFRRRKATVRAVRDVDLEVRRGEILALVGESGSGKSTVGHALLGLLPVGSKVSISGSVLVDGVDMVHGDEQRLRQLRTEHLGAVFQDPSVSLNPTMRIGHQIAEAAGSLKEAERLLRLVGVPEPEARLSDYPHQLSGGLRQRVCIAIALAGEPRLVVADEPTTALDVTVQAQILDLIVELRDRIGCSFLFVTHDLGVAGQIADRIAVMYGGRLAEVGSSDQVLRWPEHPYTRGLLASRLGIDVDRNSPLPVLAGDASSLPDEGCPFAPRCPHAVAVCRERTPTLTVTSGDHASACLRHRELPPHDVDATEELRAWGPVRVSDTAPAVVVDDVAVDYRVGRGRRRRTLQALRGVTLRVHAGEAVALVGESGSGKSTLLRAVAGLVDPTSGSLTLGPGPRPQMVFQDAGASLTPWLTIGEQIGERLLEERLDRAKRHRRVVVALERVGLSEDVAGVRPRELSGGQRQRAVIARAIVVPPGLLLCDEPTSALDVSLVSVVLNLIGELRRELGMAVLFVTHDLAAARVIADRIAVMYLGRLVETGEAERLVSEPVHPYTEALLSAVPSPLRQRIRLDGEPASALSPPPGCAFHPRCPRALETCASRSPHVVSLDRAGTPHLVDCVHAEVPAWP